MKRILLSSLLMLSLAVSGTAFAQETDRAGDKREADEQVRDIKKTDSSMTVEKRLDEARKNADVRRTELRDKLREVRDGKKRDTVERIHQNLNELNARMSKHFSAVLDKLTEVLRKVSSRVEKSDAKNTDTAPVKTAIVKAEAAIKAARNAVEAQAGKTYNVVITDEQKLRTDVGTARQALHADLMKVHAAVKAAREAVREAAIALAHSRSDKAPTTNQ